MDSYSPRARKKLTSSAKTSRLRAELRLSEKCSIRKSASGFGLNRLNRSKNQGSIVARPYPQDQAEALGDIDLDLRRTKTEGAHPDAPRAMSVVPRVSIPSRTSALEELVVRGAEGVGTGRQAYSRLTDDKRVIYYHELPTGTPRHRQRHYHYPASSSPSFLAVALPSSSFLPPTVPFPSAARWRLFKLPFPPPIPLPPCHSSPRPRRARPASFIRRKIHLHNGPHAHRLLTRSIRIVYTPSWKLTSSTTTRTYVNNMYIQGVCTGCLGNRARSLDSASPLASLRWIFSGEMS